MVTKRTTPRSGEGRKGPDAVRFGACVEIGRGAAGLSPVLLALALAGCVETTAERDPQPQMPQRTNMVQRDGVSLRAASIGIGIDSNSPQASERLWNAVQAQASSRDVAITDQKAAKYVARGYLSASPVQDGAIYAVVWDVYDAKHPDSRIQRIDDRTFVKGSTGSLDAIDDTALAQIAAASADDLAAVLSNMPEAVAATPVKPAVARAADTGTTTVAGSSPALALRPTVAPIGVAAR